MTAPPSPAFGAPARRPSPQASVSTNGERASSGPRGRRPTRSPDRARSEGTASRGCVYTTEPVDLVAGFVDEEPVEVDVGFDGPFAPVELFDEALKHVRGGGR